LQQASVQQKVSTPTELAQVRRRVPVLQDINNMEALSEQYGVMHEDVQLIAFNGSATTIDLPLKRVRFKIAMLSRPEDVFYLGIPVLETNTPFHVSSTEKKLYFNGREIAEVVDLENDTCDTSYFRRGDTVLVLNTNSRSTCSGCAFCATLRQVATDQDRIQNDRQLEAYVARLFQSSEELSAVRPHFHRPTVAPNELNFSKLYQLTSVTGHFGSEDAALADLLMVNRYFKDHGFKGTLLYLGSEIRSDNALKKLREEVDKPFLALTLECFTRREKIMKRDKASLTLDGAVELLRKGKDMGIEGGFTYIVGLDPLKDMAEGMAKFAPEVTRFPMVQIFQPHWEEQKGLRPPEATSLEYYLQARRVIEGAFRGTGLKPEPWQNYRSLWYFTYDGKELNDVRI
jgi:hypothetical protein